MDAAAPFQALFVAERPPDLLVALRATCAQLLRAMLIQAPVRARPELVPGEPQVVVDRPVAVVKRRQLHLQWQWARE